MLKDDVFSDIDIDDLLTPWGDNQEINLERDSGGPINGETEHPVSQHQATHDHQVTEGTLTITQADAEQTQHSVSQYQANHNQASGPSRKKIPLNDEQRKRKRLADKNHREKKKQNSKDRELEFQALKRKVKDLESQLQDSNGKVKDFERKEELWNEERNSKDQKIGRLKSKVKRLKEDGFGEILELGGVKTEFHKLKGVHASTIVEEDMSKERLQIEENYNKQLHLKTREDTNISNEIRERQVLLEKMLLRELPMKQKKLGQEDNGRLRFMGDGRPITARDMEELKSMMMTQFRQLSQRIDALKTQNPLSQAQDASIGPQRMDALKTPNPPSHASCAFIGHTRFSSSSYDPQDRSTRDGKDI